MDFFGRYPHLHTLILNKLGYYADPDDPITETLHMHELRNLSLLDVFESNFEYLFRPFDDTDLHEDCVISTSLDYMYSVTLNELWPYFNLRSVERFRLIIRPSQTGIQLILEDANDDPQDREVLRAALGMGLAMGPGFFFVDYWQEARSLEMDYPNLLTDTQRYIERVDEVYLEDLPLGRNSPVNHFLHDRPPHIVQLLQQIPGPTVLEIYSADVLEGVWVRSNEFIWPSIRFIAIWCWPKTAQDEIRDQDSINTVAEWLQSPALIHLVHVQLVGHWVTSRESLDVSVLSARCQQLEDTRDERPVVSTSPRRIGNIILTSDPSS